MRKRAKRKYTWFPTIGAAGPGESNDNFNQLLATIQVPPDGTSVVAISPVVPDVPMEGDDIDVNAPGQLVQSLGQEYLLERIVGKCFLACSGPGDDLPTTSFPKVVLVGCGFFVARANDSDAGGGVNTPIGSASLPERIENYSPLSEDAIREPWIWRNTWILNSGQRIVNQATSPFANSLIVQAGTGLATRDGGITSNVFGGSGMDGPFFDARSVRRIGNDERLWFAIAARTLDVILNIGTPNGLGTLVNLVLDNRVLGRLTRAHNRSSF